MARSAHAQTLHEPCQVRSDDDSPFFFSFPGLRLSPPLCRGESAVSRHELFLPRYMANILVSQIGSAIPHADDFRQFLSTTHALTCRRRESDSLEGEHGTHEIASAGNQTPYSTVIESRCIYQIIHGNVGMRSQVDITRGRGHCKRIYKVDILNKCDWVTQVDIPDPCL